MSIQDHIYTVIDNKDAVVTYNYIPETPNVWYLRNGDPGYPGDPSEVEILSITFKGGTSSETNNLSDDLYDRLCEEIEEDVLLMDFCQEVWYKETIRGYAKRVVKFLKELYKKEVTVDEIINFIWGNEFKIGNPKKEAEWYLSNA